MRSSRMRTLLALLLVVVLGSFPATATAVSQTEVQKLQAQIKALQDEAGRAEQAYSEAYWKLDATRVEIAKVDADIAAAQARLNESTARLNTRATEMYKTGGTDYIGILLSSDDFDEMLLRLEYVQRVGQQDADIIVEVQQVQAELAAKHAELEALHNTQAEEAARLQEESARVDAQLRGQQEEYNKLKKQLDAAIAAEKARNSTRTSAAAGPNGMVFPVQGPCTYSDTWGAARSGGRSHKGTDIMAPLGTPCVAVLSGTVRISESALGGKTIWLTADNGWAFYYAHLSAYKVQSGQRVSAGQLIGLVGSTGNAGTTNHLHFEIHPNGGAAVNPYPYLRNMQ